MNTLQSFVLPNLAMPLPEEMYLRTDANAWAELGTGVVHLDAGSVVSSDTFFNGLTVGTWKRACRVEQLALLLRGRGSVVVTIGLHRLEQASVWLAERRVDLSATGREPGTAVLPIEAWAALTDGMLFFRLRAIGPAEWCGGGYVTTDAPLNEVRLGIVITHFNRRAQVQAAIARIRRELLDAPALAPHLTLTAVDNSRNLEVPAHPLIRHLPNRNLGGTGGFVRGLLSLMDGDGDIDCDAQRHTHALFMDDDASCETESIARTLALLQYATHPRRAVAGALLREVAPWSLLEKGARFDSRVLPLHAGLDMRRIDDLLRAERAPAASDYGAWWFFAFPIDQVVRFPFPFFVRGDDISFGLSNRFEIETLNGVACIGEDFGAKHGPMTAYLDARYHLVQALTSPRGGAAAMVLWVGRRLFMKSLSAYLYASAAAVTLALRHTLEGPEFFRRHLDLDEVRQTIRGFTPNEAMLPIDRRAIATRPARRKEESVPRRWVRALTLQGFLLPGFLIKDRTTVQPKNFHGRASGVFRYRRVLYEHVASGTGFVAEYDRARFFRELAAFLGVWARLLWRLPALRREYAAGAEALTSVEFWRQVYREPPAAPREPAAGALAEHA
jgi:hypothetical protein